MKSISEALLAIAVFAGQVEASDNSPGPPSTAAGAMVTIEFSNGCNGQGGQSSSSIRSSPSGSRSVRSAT
jgi:hypothetical protein